MTRRADRLFQIAELLRGRRLTTAQQLADWLSVSPRTVYRDVRDLQLSGVPIEGEAGIGYRLNRNASLPPLTFTAEELAALAVGARMLETWGGARFAGGARSALAKIASAMPADKRTALDRLPVFAPSFHIDETFCAKVDAIHQAVDTRHIVSFDYRDRLARTRSAACGRSGSCTGADAGRSARGASCATISARSTSRGWATSRCTSSFPTWKAGASPTTCGSRRRRDADARGAHAPRATTIAIATRQVHCAAGCVGRDGAAFTSRPPPGLEARRARAVRRRSGASHPAVSR
jgi:biotin operon repressor